MPGTPTPRGHLAPGRQIEQALAGTAELGSSRACSSLPRSNATAQASLRAGTDAPQHAHNTTHTLPGACCTASPAGGGGGLRQLSACLGDALHGLAGELRQVAVERELVVQDLVGLDFNIGCLPLGPSQRLMDHDAAVGQAVPLALRQSRQHL